MKVAILGTRGVPAAYSGFETCVEAVGKRLVTRGHHVTVYCRSRMNGEAKDMYLGMRRVTLPSVPSKGLETLSHTLLSTVHATTRERPDVALVFGVGNAIFCGPMRRAGVPVAINVDGPDWSRRKWGGIGRRFLHWSERVAGPAANAVIADSQAVARYYQEQYRTSTSFIPYGADLPAQIGTDTLLKFGVEPRGYLLAVGRFVPENGLHDLIRAYAEVRPSVPFVVVGDASYGDAYKRELKAMAPSGVIFTGYQFGAAYHELSHHAHAFLFAGEVGGTHPVLVEQLAHGNCILVRWTDSNAEVIGDAGLYFTNEAELAEKLKLLLADRPTVEGLRSSAIERAKAYSWDRVTDQYEQLLERVARVNGSAK
jgi:glycosyltransferase involved in cell wall biosynthesis